MANAPCAVVSARLTKADVADIRPLKGKANADTFCVGEGIDWTTYDPGQVTFDTFAGEYDPEAREWVGVLRFFLAVPDAPRVPFDVLRKLMSRGADPRPEPQAESEDD